MGCVLQNTRNAWMELNERTVGHQTFYTSLANEVFKSGFEYISSGEAQVPAMQTQEQSV
jgi:hypothetical protein